MDLFYIYLFLFFVGAVILLLSTFTPTSNDPLQKNRIWIFYSGFGLVVLSCILVIYNESFKNQIGGKI